MSANDTSCNQFARGLLLISAYGVLPQAAEILIFSISSIFSISRHSLSMQNSVSCCLSISSHLGFDISNSR